jgi:outer membrane PBP1 activator LpoA protein
MPRALHRLIQLLPPTLLPLLLVACGTMPEPLPDRRGPAQAEVEAPAEPGPGDDLRPPGDVPPQSADPLFQPVADALARGDWLGATLAMPTPAAEPDPDTAAWMSFYRARIAHTRGHLADADAELAALSATALPETLQRALLAHRLQQARLSADAGAVADLSLALWQAGGYGEFSPRLCEALLWSAAQAVETAPRNEPEGWYSWWTLARAADIASGQAAAAALERWLGEHPGHPARWRGERLLQGALLDASVSRAAMLLPLSGPLERAGDAVHQGALAEYFAAEDGLQRIDLFDSRRFNTVTDAYRQAVAEGAEVTIGPLGKRQVGELLASDLLGGPVVTLNRPETALVAGEGVALQLSLAPEDEAQQIARRAWAGGARRALLLRPEGVWGERMERALLTQWAALGGRVAARAVYGNPATHSQALESALDLEDSARRSREVRDLFGAAVETQGRRRDDIGVVFLLAKSSEEARSLRPLLNYHYAGDLPVYALSTADAGDDNTAANRDLEDVRLPVMPWRIGNKPPGLASAPGAYAALHALGADALAVARRSHRLASGADLHYRGFTARLAVDSDGALLRELPMAEFDRGRLQPR